MNHRIAAIVLLAAAAPGARAADAEAGRRQAAVQCATCHGPTGLSQAPDAPNLAGQPEIYLVQQLQRFRDGRRPHEVMNVIAKPLRDGEIADLAAWYASIAIEAKPPK
jgi:cytochrome c553